MSGGFSKAPPIVYRVKVFLSWSGQNSRSHIIARGLHDWIQNVIHFADPFLSSSDVFVGERWNGVLGRELDDSGFGILCVTKRSLASPWLLFEAGVLAGGYRNPRRVCPYLIDVTPEELTPPLNQFHAAVANEAGTLAMMKSLNATPGGQLLRDEVLNKSFGVWWNDMATVISEAKDLPE